MKSKALPTEEHSLLDPQELFAFTNLASPSRSSFPKIEKRRRVLSYPNPTNPILRNECFWLPQTYDASDQIRTFFQSDPKNTPRVNLGEKSVEFRSLELDLVSNELFFKTQEAKEKIGKIPHQIYLTRRTRLFPECASGSKKYKNRAGDKLEAVLSTSGILLDLRKKCNNRLLRFADICGGPGAFSEMLFKWFFEEATEISEIWGCGITLRTENHRGEPNAWYPELYRKTVLSVKDRKIEKLNDQKLCLSRTKTFTPLWGVDGTGNILIPENVVHTIQACLQAERSFFPRSKHTTHQASLLHNFGRTGFESGVELVVADGGFDVTGEEHLQEIKSSTLILAETIIALGSLCDGGHMVVKTFDMLTVFTSSLLLLISYCFERVGIFKPYRSRVVNSERYIVGINYRREGLGVLLSDLIVPRLLTILHKVQSPGVTNITPYSLCDVSHFKTRGAFMERVKYINTYLMERQTKCLNCILRNKRL